MGESAFSPFAPHTPRSPLRKWPLEESFTIA